MSTRELRKLEQIRRDLATATNIEQYRAIEGKAEKLRKRAKAAKMPLEIENLVFGTRLLAEWNIGSTLGRLHLHGGDRRSVHRQKDGGLEDLGFSPDYSARCQRIASVPQDVLCEYVRVATLKGEKATFAGLLRFAVGYPSSHSQKNNTDLLCKIAADECSDSNLLYGLMELDCKPVDIMFWIPPHLEAMAIETRGNHVFNFPDGLPISLIVLACLEQEHRSPFPGELWREIVCPAVSSPSTPGTESPA